MTCQYCGQEIGPDCNGIQYLRNDPYLEEVYLEIVERLYCDGQWYERKKEV